MNNDNIVERVANIPYRNEDYFTPTIDDLKLGLYYYLIGRIQSNIDKDVNNTYNSIKYRITEKAIKDLPEWLTDENKQDFIKDTYQGVQWKIRMKYE